MANANVVGRAHQSGGQPITSDAFPKHHVADISNLHPTVPEHVRHALGVVASYVASLNRPGHDPKQAASRLAAFVFDLNALVR